MKEKEVGKNDLAWSKIFSDYNIIERVERDGIFEINSSAINKYREARLMTKFDNSSSLPYIFKSNGFSILPISRGSYVISDFKAYHSLEETDNNKIRYFPFPDFIQSFDCRNITSEAIALNSAFISGVLKDFTGEENLYQTLSGRMSSDKFSFIIDRKRGTSDIGVINSQVEIDGGYEGGNSITLVEAKNYINKDFLVRQIYYPFRLLSSKCIKPVRPVFMIYSNGVFNFYEFEFADLSHYNSIRLIRANSYTLEPAELTKEELYNLALKTKYIEEPRIPFPQADSFNRIINLCEFLKADTLLHKEITMKFGFTDRQTDYYTNAGIYLELIKKHRVDGDIIYSLSAKGKELLRQARGKRNKGFIELILKHRPFNEALRLFFTGAEINPLKEEIVEIMKRSDLYNINTFSTYQRRSSTVASWLNWILSQTSD